MHNTYETLDNKGTLTEIHTFKYYYVYILSNGISQTKIALLTRSPDIPRQAPRGTLGRADEKNYSSSLRKHIQFIIEPNSHKKVDQNGHYVKFGVFSKILPKVKLCLVAVSSNLFSTSLV